MLRIFLKCIAFLSIAAFLPSKSFAATIDCLTINSNEIYRVNALSPHFNNCFLLNDLDPNNPLVITVFSTDKTTSMITFYNSSFGSQNQKLFEQTSDAAGVMAANATIGQSSAFFQVAILNKFSQNKIITLNYKKEQDVNILTVVVVSERIAAAPPPEEGCDPLTGICTQPLRLGLRAATCTGDLKPPSRMPTDLDLEEHAAFFRALNQYITFSHFPWQVERAKLQVVVILFAPYSVYDVKKGTVYSGSQEAGNYIFGYLGSAFGYSQSQLVHLGAVAQQYQNVLFNGATWAQFQAGMKVASGPNPETADNPGDSQLIKNGQSSEKSGCDTSPQTQTPTGGSSLAGQGSWGGSGGFSVGASTCYGICYTTTVTVGADIMPN